MRNDSENLIGIKVLSGGENPQLIAEFRLEGGMAVPVGKETQEFLKQYARGIFSRKEDRYVRPENGRVYLQAVAAKFALCAGTVLKPMYGDGEK